MTQKLRGHSNIAEYEMTVTRPAWTRSIRIKAWDDRAKESVFIRILEPPKDAGTSFLRIKYNLWNYLPKVEKVMKIPPSMMLQPWMGSDFSNDDLVKESSYVDDYEHQIIGHEVRAGVKLVQIELTPKPNAPVVWGKVIYWVREKDDLPIAQQFIDERGRLVKELTFGEFKVMDGVLHPAFWEMKNRQKVGQQTSIRILNVDFDPAPPIPESFFTEQHLRR
jgi:outer membrane lipoprotein-sorting protein